MTDIQFFIKSLFNRFPLSATDSEKLFGEMLAGKLSDVQIAGILGAMAARGETTGEILGAVKAMRSKAVPIDGPEGIVDCCGTGGDQSGTFNVSTAVSFVVAGCGIPVAKHGNRASSSKSGAADVLESLGVNLDAGLVEIRKSLWENDICFLMAPVFNPAAKHVAPVRSELKARTIFNLLGPLLNPAGAKRQLIGVYDRKWMKPMAKVLKQLGSIHAWVVHGFDGLDEITVTDKTYVVELKDGEIKEFEINTADYGFPPYEMRDLRGGDAHQNSQDLRNLLDGKKGAYRDIVLVNSAATLVVSSKVDNLSDGIKMAAKSIDDGLAKEKLKNMVEIYK